MSILEMVLLAITLLFALGASWVLLMPFFNEEEEARTASLDQGIEFEEELRRKERLLEALEDLELEQASGKIRPEDYEKTKAELTKEAAECLARLDSLVQSGIKQTITEQTAAGQDEARCTA